MLIMQADQFLKKMVQKANLLNHFALINSRTALTISAYFFFLFGFFFFCFPSSLAINGQAAQW